MQKFVFLFLLPFSVFCQEQANQHNRRDPTNTSFNVMDFGAKGIGKKHDDTKAFQDAVKAAIAVHGKLVIPAPSYYFNITNTIEIVPMKGTQCYLTIEGWGHTASQIHYTGKGNQPVFKVLGLKASSISGIKVVIAKDISGVQVWDIDTNSEAESTTGVTFKNCMALLGDKENNVGWRLGHRSAGTNNDISHYLWENCSAYGDRDGGPQPGQIGWLIEGHNTLSNSWMGSFGAFLDKLYSNSSQMETNAAAKQGNGSVFFFGTGGSHNNIDFEIACSGTYLVSGGRFEEGKVFMNVKPGSDHPAITMTAVQLSTYRPKDGCVFNMDRPGTLILDGCRLLNADNKAFTSNMIRLGGMGEGRGALIVRGGAYAATQPFYTRSDQPWEISILGVGKLSGTRSTQNFTNEK